MYVCKDGFYQKSYKHIIITVILSILVLLFGAVSAFSTTKYYSTRRQLDTAREQLAAATETNRELTGRIEQCSFIVNELGESTGRNITTIRECIEAISEIREQVGALEVALGLFNSDGYYNWLDSYISDSEGVDIE